MASSVIRHERNIISITVTHGTVEAGQANTVTINDSRFSGTDLVSSPQILGNYNSDITPWSFYTTTGTLVSRIKNLGTNTATNIIVNYKVLLS